jgi:hypothetical protein
VKIFSNDLVILPNPSHQHFFEIVYKRFVKIIPEHLCQQAGLLFGSFVSWGNCPLHNFLAEANDFSSIPFYATY